MTLKSRIERGELDRLKEATGASKTHLHFVLNGERQPSLELAEKLDAAGRPVWVLYPDLKQQADGAEGEAVNA